MTKRRKVTAVVEYVQGESGPLYDVAAEGQAMLDASKFDKAWEWIEVRRSLLQDLVALAKRMQA